MHATLILLYAGGAVIFWAAFIFVTTLVEFVAFLIDLNSAARRQPPRVRTTVNWGERETE